LFLFGEKTMKISNSFIYLILSFFVITNIWLKFCSLIIICFLTYKKCYKKIDKKEILIDVVCCTIIYITNKLIGLNLDVINFSFFSLINVCLGHFKINIKKENYLSIYYFFILIFGVLSCV